MASAWGRRDGERGRRDLHHTVWWFLVPKPPGRDIGDPSRSLFLPATLLRESPGGCLAQGRGLRSPPVCSPARPLPRVSPRVPAPLFLPPSPALWADAMLFCPRRARAGALDTKALGGSARPAGLLRDRCSLPSSRHSSGPPTAASASRPVSPLYFLCHLHSFGPFSRTPWQETHVPLQSDSFCGFRLQSCFPATGAIPS